MTAWYWGAIINVSGCIAINLGTNVMKLGHNKRALLPGTEEQKPSVAKFREWQIGVFIFALGNIANFVSFGFAAQSLLAALGSIQFVTNVIFASLVLKEKATLFIIIATALIIGGCIILVVFGDHSSAVYTGGQLLDLYGNAPYIVYLVLSFVFVAGFYALYLRGTKITSQSGQHWAGWSQVLPVAYSLFSALIGTQSVLFSKSLSVLIRTTFEGNNQLGNWFTWVVLVCFVLSAGFWMTRLNKGLKLFPALIIVPLLQICWTLFSIVEGLLYFQEYQQYTALRACMFALGVLLIFVGVYLLTTGGKPKPVYGKMEERPLEKVSDSGSEQYPDSGSTRLIGPNEQSSNGDVAFGGDDDSMFGDMRTFRRRMRSDFGISWDKEVAKQALGLGAGSMMGISVFTMPTIDVQPSTPTRSSRGLDVNLSDIHFQNTDVEGGPRHLHKLETITEAPSMTPSETSLLQGSADQRHHQGLAGNESSRSSVESLPLLYQRRQEQQQPAWRRGSEGGRSSQDSVAQPLVSAVVTTAAPASGSPVGRGSPAGGLPSGQSPPARPSPGGSWK